MVSATIASDEISFAHRVSHSKAITAQVCQYSRSDSDTGNPALDKLSCNSRLWSPNVLLTAIRESRSVSEFALRPCPTHALTSLAASRGSLSPQRARALILDPFRQRSFLIFSLSAAQAGSQRSSCSAQALPLTTIPEKLSSSTFPNAKLTEKGTVCSDSTHQ